MRVRSRVRYESISEGDVGIFKQSNDGTPPAQFNWDGLGGETYWVHWHMVEMVSSSDEEEDEENDGMYASTKYFCLK